MLGVWMKSAQNWKDIPGFTGFQVSDQGNVRRGDKVLRQHVAAKGGGRYVNLGKTTRLVHKLVLLAFVGHRAGRITHRNGNRSDNRLANLFYGRRDHSPIGRRCRKGHELAGESVIMWGSNRICVLCRDGVPAVRELPERL